MNIQQYKIQVLPIKDKLFRLAFRVTGNVGIAEDVVQEVLIKLWEIRQKLAQYDNLEAFAMRVTKNLSIDKTRSKHRKTDSLSGINETLIEEGNPLVYMEQKDTIEQIKQLMESLPEKQKLTMHLRDIEEMSYQEIADILGITMNQVKVNLFRARKQIRAAVISRGIRCL